MSDTVIEGTMKALELNRMKAYLAADRDEARKMVLGMIDGRSVGTGGSLTLDECGIRDALRKAGRLLDWHKPGITPDEKDRILARTLSCDTFLTGTNAITMDGKLYNVDGRGNRLAALIYGPRKVIVVAGKNKIVKGVMEAKERMETIAGPRNAKRLKKNTPCVDTGHCVDCRSPERICSHTVITEQQQRERIHVIIVDEELGI